METLLLSGSPNPSGDTMNLSRELLKHLHGTVDIYSSYRDKISPCVDCRYCWERPVCAIRDKMQDIHSKIDSYDHIIIASPVHFMELSGSLLSVTSRFQLYWANRVLRDTHLITKPKTGVLLLAGGGDDPGRAVETAAVIFSELNTKMIGHVFAAETDKLPAKNNRTAMEQVRRLAALLNDD